MDVTENTYAELAAEVVGEYAEKKSLMGYWKNKLLREVKGKWAAYQDEYQNFTDENKKSDQV
jgi:chitinase